MDDDDPLKRAAAGLEGFGLSADKVLQIMPGLIGNARLYKQDIESVAKSFGTALASGNVGSLTRSGVTLSPEDLAYIDAATSAVDKQNRMFERVKASMEQYALSMNEGLSDAEKTARRTANELDSAQSAIGKGAANAQASMDSLTARLLHFVSANENVAEERAPCWLMARRHYQPRLSGHYYGANRWRGGTMAPLQSRKE